MSDPRPPRARTVVLFVGLFALGSSYLASLAYFLANGKNFVDAEQIASATKFAESTRLPLPDTITFDRNSPWSKALSKGWHLPDNWGVWSSRADADIVLPAIADATATAACFTFRIGTMSDLAHWTMLITVDGRPLVPKAAFSGAGPYAIQGSAPIRQGVPIQVRFAGPGPRIPNLISRHNHDPRGLAYRLLGMTVAPQCGKP